jgi:UDP-N-acetylenolpyruvoylglucosamine reductase
VPEVSIDSLTEPDIAGLQAALRGELIQFGDKNYDVARRVYNAMIDRQPRLIARCVDIADVIASVNFAREHNLTLAVRGGSHNVAGFGVCDDGLVIDLSLMKSIRVDPKRRTARAEGGCTWGDYDHATHAFGLATPSGFVSTTGVGGLTLGGGIGHLARRYGLSCDNLVSADVVTADGSFLTASSEENQDLFWALRGGGGNFGVVTSFEFRLHPVSTVLGGPVFYPIDECENVLRFYRDYIAEAPAEMSAFFGFHLAPPAPFIPEHLHLVPVCAIVACYSGELERGEEVVRPLREFGPPAVDLLGRMPYPALNSLFDALLPPGLQHYWQSDFVSDLNDEAIAVHVEHGPKVPTVPSAMHIYPLDGAIHRVEKHETAFSYRDADFLHMIMGVGEGPEHMPEYISWVRGYWSALRPFSAGGAYVNALIEESGNRVKARHRWVRTTYRDNYERLVEIKRKYDPNNLFHVNQNIDPN